MKICGANEAIILVSQTNDGAIGIADGILAAGIISRVVFLYLYYWHDDSNARNFPYAPLSFFRKNQLELKIAGTLGVSTIAIKFNGLAGAFTRGAAIFSVRLCRTTANRVLTNLLFVCHKSSLLQWLSVCSVSLLIKDNKDLPHISD
jgi:hypothetical protein